MQTPSNNLRKSPRAGFTLIELLVGVLIVGVLNAVVLPLYRSAVKQSAVATVKTNLRLIAEAAESYRVKYGRYPADFDNTQKNGTGAPAAFIGANRDLASVPFGPHKVWYKWRLDTGDHAGQFTVIAYEDGEDLWHTSRTDNYGVYNLRENRYYLQGGSVWR